MSERRQLSVKEEEKYIKLYTSTGDINARNEILYNLYPMAKTIAEKYSTDEFAYLKEDIQSVAVSALLEGIEKWLSHREVYFLLECNFKSDHLQESRLCF